MRRYRCHKVVEAAEIVQHGDGFVLVRHENGAETRVSVPETFMARGEPSNGDFLVRYLPDNYLSWSPRKAFLDGYSPEDA